MECNTKRVEHKKTLYNTSFCILYTGTLYIYMYKYSSYMEIKINSRRYKNVRDVHNKRAFND